MYVNEELMLLFNKLGFKLIEKVLSPDDATLIMMSNYNNKISNLTSKLRNSLLSINNVRLLELFSLSEEIIRYKKGVEKKVKIVTVGEEKIMSPIVIG